MAEVWEKVVIGGLSALGGGIAGYLIREQIGKVPVPPEIDAIAKDVKVRSFWVGQWWDHPLVPMWHYYADGRLMVIFGAMGAGERNTLDPEVFVMLGVITPDVFAAEIAKFAKARCQVYYKGKLWIDFPESEPWPTLNPGHTGGWFRRDFDPTMRGFLTKALEK
jgi:hypothetical protein